MANFRSFPFKFITLLALAFATACQTGRGGPNDVDGTGNGVFDGGNGADPPDDPFSGDDAVALELRVIVDGVEVDVPVTVEVSGETKTVDASKGIALDEDLIGEAVFVAGDPTVTADDGRPLVVTDENLNVAPSPGLQWFTVKDGTFTWVDGNVVTIALIPYFKATAMKCDATAGSTTIPYSVGDIEVKQDGTFVLNGIGHYNKWSADSDSVNLDIARTAVSIIETEYSRGPTWLDFTYDNREVNCTWQ